LRMEMTELALIIDAAVETARPSIDAKRHTLQIDLAATPVHLMADPMRLAQIISNLLTNAAKYTDPNGHITLRAARDAEAITIIVADDGIGIPAEAIGDVFTMFSQVKSAQDRSDGGLGIGLALAKGLVDLHGGTIQARSAGTGRGSEFIVKLPAPLLATPQPPLFVEPTATLPHRRRRILIADDNEDAAHSLAALLRLEGHEVAVVNDGREALDAISAQQPEIALLDIRMPEINGYELAQQLRDGPFGASITLIAVTGWGQERDKARALSAGFDYHFTKPVEPDELIELLRRVEHQA
jgi:CheY-like chemotaxis protein